MKRSDGTALFVIVGMIMIGFLSPILGAQEAPTVLITGSNRGLGLEFSKQYAERDWKVIATVRRPETAEDLKLLAASHSNVHIERLDVTDDSAIKALAEKLKGQPIDLLLNNAGILGDISGQFFGKLEHDEFMKIMSTNALGPLMIAQFFIDNVKASKQKKIVAISSLAGSFGRERRGLPGTYFYKASKAALNMLMRTLAQDLRSDGVTVILISPGTVDTGQIGIKSPRLVDIEVSIAGIIETIDQVTIENSGTFISYDGEVQAW
jgi:NAD(P)-dependent dehydrogenase (short-subunit alcohol dehydrogenase family)